MCDTFHMMCETLNMMCDTLNMICDTFAMMCDTFDMTCDTFDMMCDPFHMMCNTLHMMLLIYFSLERSLKSLYGKLMELFLSLYLSPRAATPQFTATMTTVRNMVATHLGDYKEYLTVKAQRNITMTSYPSHVNRVAIDSY